MKVSVSNCPNCNTPRCPDCDTRRFNARSHTELYHQQAYTINKDIQVDPGPILDIGYISPVRHALVGIVEEQEEWEEEVLA